MTKSEQLNCARLALCGGGALVLAMASPAQAQDTPQAGAATAADDQAIVVTGSRIQRRDYSSDTPLTTISSEALEASSDVSIDSSLKELPQFSGGIGATGRGGTGITGFAGQDVQATPTNSPGIATLDLRGIGSNRTLILLDGRRTQPANATLVVDINTIPKAALDGVEVITGGAGSTYGADAVAGVVNFKLKRNFQGVNIDTSIGVSEKGDGRQVDSSLLIGGNFGDGRGNAMFGVSYSKRDIVFQRNRKFFQEGFADPNVSGGSAFFGSSYVFVPSTNTTGVPGVTAGFNFPPAGNPTQAALNAVFARYGVAPGDVTVAGPGASASLFFNKNANPAAATLFSGVGGRVSGRPSPNYNGQDPNVKLLSNGNAAFVGQEGYIQLPLERYSMFGSAHYDVSDGIEVYAQGKFDQNKVSTQSTFAPAFSQLGVGITFDAATCGAAVGHPVPQDLCDVLRSRTVNPNAPWALNQALTFMGAERVTTTTYSYEVLAGVRGNVGIKDWTFDIFGSHGKTTQDSRYDNFVDLDLYQTLIGLPNYGANATFLQPRLGLNAKCTSGLNPFSTAPVSQDCQDLIQAKIKATTDITQTQAELNLQGGLFTLPAGELRFAVGSSYRKNAFDYEPSGPLDSQTINSAVISLNGVLPTKGSIEVKEFYGEVLIPVLADLPFVKSLEINAGYRYSDYNTAGGVSTWKVTGDWDINDWIKIRGGYQVANRAPNVAEIFQPGVYTTVNWPGGDPCATHAKDSVYVGYGNRPDNPNRAKVLALCSAISGGFPIGPDFVGNQPQLFPLGRDVTLGNPDLQSEEGRTITIGTVIRSPFRDTPLLSRMTLSVDYYNIEVRGAVSTLSTDYVYRQCLNFDGQSNPSFDPNNSFCKRIIRDPSTGYWSATQAFFENLGKIATAGVDVNFNWAVPAPGIGGAGSFTTNVAFNYLDKYDVQNLPGGQVFSYRDTIGSNQYFAQFKWKLNTSFTYNFGQGSIGLNWRHLPKVRYFTYATSALANELKIKEYDIFDLSARFAATENIEVRMGVDNLFDKQPPRVGVRNGTLAQGGTTQAGVTDPSVYDILGRRVYVGAKLKF